MLSRGMAVSETTLFYDLSTVVFTVGTAAAASEREVLMAGLGFAVSSASIDFISLESYL